MPDEGESSMRSLFQGLDTTEVESFLVMYRGVVEGRKNTAVENLKSLILRHCQCESSAATTTPIATARASVQEVNGVIKAMGKGEEFVSEGLVVKIALLNEAVHSRCRATPTSVSDLSMCLTAAGNLVTDQALQAMGISAEDFAQVIAFPGRVDESNSGLKKIVASLQKRLDSKHTQVYAEILQNI